MADNALGCSRKRGRGSVLERTSGSSPGARWLIAAVSLWFSLLAPVALADSLADVIERVRPGVVGVGTAYPPRQPADHPLVNRIRGSGFVVGDGSLVVTSSHVLPTQLDRTNHQSLAVFSGRGDGARVHRATLVARDADHDLAVVRIEGGPLPSLTLGDAAGVREGEPVAFTGFPIGAVLGLYPATHRGIVSAITPIARAVDNALQLTPTQLTRLRDRFEVFQLDAVAYPGNSGSPLYQPGTGRVVGVINSAFVKETREAVLEHPSGITFAIPIDHVKALLERIAADGQ